MAKVLIVDDEPGMRQLLEVNLRRDVHTVVEAGGAQEAISGFSALFIREGLYGGCMGSIQNFGRNIVFDSARQA